MRKLAVFESISLDGYFTGENGDLSWAHTTESDPEFDAFVESNAKGEGLLVFGRVTYQMMESYWPTPMALENDPVVARRMNEMPKLVFSRTLEKASWSNTRLVRGDTAAEIRRFKREGGDDMTILGSGTIVSLLAGAGLVDEYQFVVIPVVLGRGRTLFEGVRERANLKLTGSRAFASGKVLVSYKPAEHE